MERLDDWTDYLLVALLALAAVHSDDPAAKATYLVGLLVFTRLALR